MIKVSYCFFYQLCCSFHYSFAFIIHIFFPLFLVPFSDRISLTLPNTLMLFLPSLVTRHILSPYLSFHFIYVIFGEYMSSPCLDIKIWNSATVYNSMSSSKLWQAFSNNINFCVDVGRPFFSNSGTRFSKLVLHGTWYVASASSRSLTFKSLLSIVLATKSWRVLQISRVTLWIFVSFILTSSKFLRSGCFRSKIQRFQQ